MKKPTCTLVFECNDMPHKYGSGKKVAINLMFPTQKTRSANDPVQLRAFIHNASSPEERFSKRDVVAQQAKAYLIQPKNMSLSFIEFSGVLQSIDELGSPKFDAHKDSLGNELNVRGNRAYGDNVAVAPVPLIHKDKPVWGKMAVLVVDRKDKSNLQIQLKTYTTKESLMLRTGVDALKKASPESRKEAVKNLKAMQDSLGTSHSLSKGYSVELLKDLLSGKDMSNINSIHNNAVTAPTANVQPETPKQQSLPKPNF